MNKLFACLLLILLISIVSVSTKAYTFTMFGIPVIVVTYSNTQGEVIEYFENMGNSFERLVKYNIEYVVRSFKNNINNTINNVEDSVRRHLITMEESRNTFREHLKTIKNKDAEDAFRRSLKTIKDTEDSLRRRLKNSVEKIKRFLGL